MNLHVCFVTHPHGIRSLCYSNDLFKETIELHEKLNGNEFDVLLYLITVRRQTLTITGSATDTIVTLKKYITTTEPYSWCLERITETL